MYRYNTTGVSMYAPCGPDFINLYDPSLTPEEVYLCGADPRNSAVVAAKSLPGCTLVLLVLATVALASAALVPNLDINQIASFPTPSTDSLIKFECLTFVGDLSSHYFNEAWLAASETSLVSVNGCWILPESSEVLDQLHGKRSIGDGNWGCSDKIKDEIRKIRETRSRK